MKRLSILTILFAALLLVPASLKADEEARSAASRLAKEHADAIVSIQFVLKTRMSMGGQSRDSEESKEVRGVLLDREGFVLTASSHFEGGVPRAILRRLGDVDIDAKPSDIKVLFGNEEDEYPARLVAKDSDLGVAFLQILDLKERDVKPLDLSSGASPAVGADLLGLTRMARSFDCAPEVARCYVTASVERPRPMWALAGDFNALGMPVFTTDGRVVGVLALQEGTEGVSGEGGGGLLGMGGASEMGLFVLPLTTVKPVVERAKAKAAETASSDTSPDEEKTAPDEGSDDGE